VRERKAYAHELIEKQVRTAELSPQERDFAILLIVGVVATSGELDFLLSRALTHGSIKTDVRDALRVSVYELFFLRKEPHIAVDQGVELVRGLAPQAAGFANKLLRETARLRQTFPFGDPAHSVQALAHQQAFPLWLAERLLAELGYAAAAAFMTASNLPAPLFLADLRQGKVPGRPRLNHCAPSSCHFAPAPSVRTPPLPQVVSSSARTDLGQIDSESGAQAFIGASLTELRAIMVFGWSALVGLLFNFFTLGLTFRPYPAGLTEGPLMPKPIAYLIVAAIVYLAIRIARDPSKVLGMLCRVILPITAAITLASPFLERIIVFSSTPLLSFVPYLGIAPFNVLGVAVVFLILQRAQTVDARLSPRLMTRACAVILAACAGSMAAGMAVFRLMGTDAQIVSLCILSAFLVLMTLTAILEGYRGTGDGRSIEHKQRDSCCDSLAERHGLSAREREVLGLLARGHGTKWIAEHLYISPETVRTHGKRIYEKMGVHTKEELLSKVEEHESATQAARFSRGL
jgi:DNA-binding CsgD family transcriptional regulator/transcription termination factor NusB